LCYVQWAFANKCAKGDLPLKSAFRVINDSPVRSKLNEPVRNRTHRPIANTLKHAFGLRNPIQPLSVQALPVGERKCLKSKHCQP
jgi:hypothetical protein